MSTRATANSDALSGLAQARRAIDREIAAAVAAPVVGESLVVHEPGCWRAAANAI